MASRFALKTGDTGPPYEVQLEDKNGGVNLGAAASIEFLMRIKDSGATPIKKTATILNASTGKVQVKFTAGDTAVAGLYEGEFKVHWNNGEIDSFPNESYEEIIIYPSV